MIPYTDMLMNQGFGKVVDIVKSKQEISMASLLQKLSRAVYGVAPNNSAIDLDSLVSALGAAGGTYAGLAIGGANAFWLSNGGNGPTNVAGALTLAVMQTDYGRATFGNEEPDTLITTQAGWNAYWNLLVGNQRYIRDEETTRGGFRHLNWGRASRAWLN